MSSICWRCGNDVTGELINERVPFRAVCGKCFAGLHACLGCTHYKRGAPNDCDVPDIEPVKDKEAPNFCEEFRPLFQLRDKQTSSSKDIEKRLFGDIDMPVKKDPRDLFKD